MSSDSDYLINDSPVGTRGYQAPEIINGEKHSFNVDIFSCGVILFAMLMGNPPFFTARLDDTLYNLLQTNPKRFWSYHCNDSTNDRISTSAKDLISRMLLYDPSKRIGISAIISHPWFRQVTLKFRQ